MNTSVPKGLQTYVGYLSSLGLVIAAAVLTWLNTTDTTNLPPYVQLTLVVVGGILTAVTSKNRSDQAVAKTHAAAPELIFTGNPAPTSPDPYAGPVGPMSPGELDAVDLPGQEG